MKTPAKKKTSTRQTLIFLAIVMLINALSYGTIIPLFFPYAERFGMGTLGVSMLFASFSLAQFIATPLIGKLSDKYGRRPMLLLSVLGTALSLALFASAQSVFMLFVARILDGITGGNISVAQAVISDTVQGKERSKALGLLGAAFGFGFLLGPALGGVLSQHSISLPFWVASLLALVAAIVGYFILPETLNPAHKHKAKSNPIDPRVLLKIASKSGVGYVLLASFVLSISSNAFIISFQSFTNITLNMSPRDIGLLFTLVGLFSIVMQGFGVGWLLKHFKSRSRLIFTAEILSAIVLALMVLPLAHSFLSFVLLISAFQVTSAPLGPLLVGMLTEKAEEHEQGEVLGVNQSFSSVAQIIGPLAAGSVAVMHVQAGFAIAAALMAIGFLVSYSGYRSSKRITSVAN